MTRVIVPTAADMRDAVEAFASTTALGLPYPEPADPLNQGADDIKALALAVDNKLTIDAITQTVPQTNLATGANNQWNLSSIPLARLVAFSGIVVARIGGAQYVVVQIFDGAVSIAGDMALSSGATGGASNMLGTVSVIGYTFTSVPVLKVFASNSGQSIDAIIFRGIAWR
jgi:hypothetical protein